MPPPSAGRPWPTVLLLILATLAPATTLAEEKAAPEPEQKSSVWDGRTYQLNPWLEVPLVLIPGTIAVGWILNQEQASAHCAPLCDRQDVNPFDRPVAGNFNEHWALASDITLLTGLAAGLTTLFVEEGFYAGLNDLVVIIESILMTNGVTILANMAARRPRPLLYSEAAPLEERNSPRATLSFISGHAGTMAAMTTSLFSTMRRRNPGGALQWWVLGLGTAFTAGVAVGRTQSGDHFPSDVLLGTTLGACMGILVPLLHRSPVKVVPVVDGGTAMLSVSGWL